MNKIFIIIRIIWSSFFLISIIDHPTLIDWGLHSNPIKDSLFLAFLLIILFNIAGWIRKILTKKSIKMLNINYLKFEI